MNKKTCMILMIVGGAFYIAGGLMAALVAGALGGFTTGLTGSPEVAKQAQEVMTSIIVTGFISGILIIVGGILVNSEAKSRRVIGSVLGIIGALVGIVNTFAGLVVGLALTLIGAVGGIAYKSSTPQPSREPGGSMSKIRGILVTVILVIVVLAILGYLLSPKETQPTASPYELRINKIYYYKTDKGTDVILDLSARYNADGKWSVWSNGFKLLTDKGTMLETVVIPFELRECFKNELFLSVDATKTGYTLFQIAFSMPLNERPVKLTYDAFNVKIELPVTEDIVSYVSYYDYTKVKLTTKPPVSGLDVFASPSSWSVGCYIAGSEFNVSIDVKASSFMIGADKIAITKIETQVANLIDVTPELPIILSRGEGVSVKLVLQAPTNYSYSGPLDVTLTIEPAG